MDFSCSKSVWQFQFIKNLKNENCIYLHFWQFWTVRNRRQKNNEKIQKIVLKKKALDGEFDSWNQATNLEATIFQKPAKSEMKTTIFKDLLWTQNCSKKKIFFQFFRKIKWKTEYLRKTFEKVVKNAVHVSGRTLWHKETSRKWYLVVLSAEIFQVLSKQTSEWLSKLQFSNPREILFERKQIYWKIINWWFFPELKQKSLWLLARNSQKGCWNCILRVHGIHFGSKTRKNLLQFND